LAPVNEEAEEREKTIDKTRSPLREVKAKKKKRGNHRAVLKYIKAHENGDKTLASSCEKQGGEKQMKKKGKGSKKRRGGR